jgi:serine/threonine protein kinase/Flp pilus assembly protein TadD
MNDPSPLEAIFFAALEKGSQQERAAYLDLTCATDPELRRHVEKMLAASAQAGSFLEQPAASPAVTVAELPISEGPGTVFGPYKLLEQIGEGGFGVVFMAEQVRPVRRKVALKVLKPGMDTRQIVARFEAERQALALMDHPGIAHVFDGGETPAGRPYFVMELVRGIPITEFCDQNHCTIRERLELFSNVCQAIQHAHQKGIIHRDIKPSNIMVTLHDGTPVVKVIDFGIAKAIGQQLTDKTLFTNFALLIGTPLYMSPEQAQWSGLDIDTRSDIYSLGVLLYELLTGLTPFDEDRLRTVGYDEIRRIIREEEPPKPSTRISMLGPATTTVSAQRRSDPKRLCQCFRGELDWIVMKCLEKDRNRRYQTANSVVHDIQRYLHDEPVEACPPSAAYRFGKFARRHRAALVTETLLAAVLLLGTLVSAWQALRATSAQKLAQDRLEAAESNLHLARQAVDEMYTRVADQIAGQPHMQLFERDILKRALRYYQQFAERKSGDPAIQRETAAALIRVGKIQQTLGRNRQGRQACEEAIAALEKLAAALPTDRERLALLAETYTLHGAILNEQGISPQAEKACRMALSLGDDLAASHPGNPEYRACLVSSHLTLANLLISRPREAEHSLHAAIKLQETIVAEHLEDPRFRYSLGGCYSALGMFLARMGRLTEAENAYRQALDAFDSGRDSGLSRDRPVWAAVEFELGRLLHGSGRREAAEQSYRRAMAAAQELVRLFPHVPSYRRNLALHSSSLASFLDEDGRSDEAATLRRSARDLCENFEAEFEEESDKLHHLYTAGYILKSAGDLEAAERLLRRALPLTAKLEEEGSAEPANRQAAARTYLELGIVLQKRSRPHEAVDHFRQAVLICERLAQDYPDDSTHRYHLARQLNYLGIALRCLPEQAAAAAECHQKSIGLCDRLVAEFPDQLEYRRELVRARFGLGIVLRITGRLTAAVENFQQAQRDYRPFAGTTDELNNRVQFASISNELAWLRATCADASYRDPTEAVTSARKAVELAPERREFWNTLGVALYRAGDWPEAVTALSKSMSLRKGGDPFDWFFLAMAHWQLGEKIEGRKWYDQAVSRMERKRTNDQELIRFRAEAEELLQIKLTTPSRTSGSG